MLLVAVLIGMSVADDNNEKEFKPTAKGGLGTFTICKETTYITKPLDKNGYPDYVTVLNERLREGVTPENNANVLIWKALGPHPDGATMPPEYFKWLGIDPPPEKGEYFIRLNQYLKDHHHEEIKGLNSFTFFNRLRSQPWTAKDYPHIADWLKANEKPYSLIIEATKRTHYFNPAVPLESEKKPSGLQSAMFPTLWKCRLAAVGLCERAMLHIGEGKTEDAWQDLLACHRLGRLLSSGCSLNEYRDGVAIDTITCLADIGFLTFSRPDARRIEVVRKDLQSLPPLQSLAECTDQFERFRFLDSIMLVDHYGLNAIGELVGLPKKLDFSQFEPHVRGLDWDPALKRANDWYDQWVRALRTKDRIQRQKRLAELEVELRVLAGRVALAGKHAPRLLNGGPAERGQVLGELLIKMLMPNFAGIRSSPDRNEQYQTNLFAVLALAQFHCDHGSYPKDLSELAPKYLKTVPIDIYSGKPLIYKATDKGYLLYSVGQNGNDDGGHGPDDDPRGDDLVIRMPSPELKQK
jgi:hypothetical protein